MVRYDVSLEAREDLYQIWAYTVDKWSEKQADQYYAHLENCFQEIAHAPMTAGKPYDEIIPGIKARHVGRHMVFYTVQDNGRVLIVRILHERMDYWPKNR